MFCKLRTYSFGVSSPKNLKKTSIGTLSQSTPCSLFCLIDCLLDFFIDDSLISSILECDEVENGESCLYETAKIRNQNRRNEFHLYCKPGVHIPN